jgi:hypothetical protein
MLHEHSRTEILASWRGQSSFCRPLSSLWVEDWRGREEAARFWTRQLSFPINLEFLNDARTDNNHRASRWQQVPLSFASRCVPAAEESATPKLSGSAARIEDGM